MACLLNTGRKVPCKDSVGGIKAAYFADFGTMGTNNISAGQVTAFGAASPDLEFFKYDVKGNSSLEQTITSSRENGTVFYEQTLNLTLTKLDLLTQQELIEIVKARPHVMVEDYNGNFLLVGAVNGADCSGGTIVTGAAMGDLSGFTLTMAGQETLPALFVDSAIVAAVTSATQIVA
tara:strand:- start:1730 stop:2260 length:531 start_codon:yes stop_codon:yes gene_type:complete